MCVCCLVLIFVSFCCARSQLIKRMILDHPYHALLQVFALAHGDQVSRVSMSVVGGVEMNEHRIKAAADLLAELKREPAVRDLVVAQEKLILAYIALGSQKFSRGVDHINFSTTPLSTLRQRDLALVPVPTLTIPVRADCNYKTTAADSGPAPSASSQGASLSASAASLDSPIVTISAFDRTIRLATSGVNVPLILELLCSDGKKHKQLLKSADDLRQDAVMEQVFKLVNELLQSNRHASRRQLHIRTYNVVPLTPGVGLVEWVMNTISLADVLVADRVGAHARHARPGQKRDYRGCLNYLREAHEARNTDEYKARFKSVCDDFQPVFHRFFLEMFPAPAEWLARRTAYTRSVAVNSIVGFVVGLGDRHIHNILLDTHTAEVSQERDRRPRCSEALLTSLLTFLSACCLVVCLLSLSTSIWALRSTWVRCSRLPRSSPSVCHATWLTPWVPLASRAPFERGQRRACGCSGTIGRCCSRCWKCSSSIRSTRSEDGRTRQMAAIAAEPDADPCSSIAFCSVV